MADDRGPWEGQISLNLKISCNFSFAIFLIDPQTASFLISPEPRSKLTVPIRYDFNVGTVKMVRFGFWDEKLLQNTHFSSTTDQQSVFLGFEPVRKIYSTKFVRDASHGVLGSCPMNEVQHVARFDGQIKRSWSMNKYSVISNCH